jgi:hypothetical protein
MEAMSVPYVSTSNVELSIPINDQMEGSTAGLMDEKRGRKRRAMMGYEPDLWYTRMQQQQQQQQQQSQQGPRKRGRPTLMAMRLKGGQPTIYESLTMSSQLDPTRSIVEGLGSQRDAGGEGSSNPDLNPTTAFISDEVVYPDPPPGVLTWDPKNMEFHTQVPYQIQMARQEIANRLARSYVASASQGMNQVQMEESLFEVDGNGHPVDHQTQHQQHHLPEQGREDIDQHPQHHPTHHDEMHHQHQTNPLQTLQQEQAGEFSFDELEQHGLFDDQVTQQHQHQMDRSEEDREAGGPDYTRISVDHSLPELACENCGRMGTSVWRKLTVGMDSEKRTYRVCNRELSTMTV